MKKNNRGFTMIEIIGVVVIMGVLLLLIIPSVSKLMAQFRKDYYEKMELTVTESGKDFFADNKIYLPDGILESTYVNVSSLIGAKYADSLLDYRGNNCTLEDQRSYTIVVYRGDGKYEYQSCIECNEEGYTTNKKGNYCDPAWLNNNLGYDYGGTDDIYFYYGTSRDKIREELIKRLNIVRYDLEGNVLDRVVIGDTKEEGILPTNIDIINNKPVLDSENKKEYLMIYGSNTDNNKEDLNAIIYKHKAPKVTMTTELGNYSSGNWTNKTVVIKLEKNDDFFRLDNRTVKKYQWSIGGGDWQDISCGMLGDDESCTISLDYNYLNETYKFRLVNDENNISDETTEYRVKIDKYPPSVSIDVISDTVIEEFTTDPDTKQIMSNIVQYASVRVTSSDSHSGINYTRVCLGGSCNTFYGDGSKTYYYTNSGSVTAETYDYAGNSDYDNDRIYYDFIDNTTDYCTISYYGNGGSVYPSSEEVECGEFVTLPTPSRSGYDFGGWYTSGGSYAGSSGSWYAVDYDTTLYAYWNEEQPDIEMCTIYYDANGGGVSPTRETTECGTYVTLPTPTRSGYQLDGWYTSSSGGSYAGTSGTMYRVDSDGVTVYAQWTKKETAPTTYTIYYDGNGDTCKSNCQSSTVCTVGEPCTLASNNYKTANYHSTYGWNTSSSGSGTSYSSGGTVTNLASAGESVTLYSYYKCDHSARTAGIQKSSSFNPSKYPWNRADWDGTTVLRYHSDYGCTAVGGDATCFDDDHISSGYWEAYGVTCKYCGENTSWHWCPVHVSQRGAAKPVCDQSSGTYTGSSCRRG